MKKRLFIIDDHPLVLKGMQQALESEDFIVSGTAPDGETALALLKKSHPLPDLVISDVRMKKMDGFAVLERLRRLAPDLKVLLLAGMPLEDELQRAKAGSAAGYIPKSLPWDELVSAIRRVMAGSAFEGYEPPPTRGGILSPREEEILKYLNLGKTQEEIAIILGIGRETVKTHIRTLKSKLSASSAAGAVGRAYELGILRP